jgi:hypothetical protein
MAVMFLQNWSKESAFNPHYAYVKPFSLLWCSGFRSPSCPIGEFTSLRTNSLLDLKNGVADSTDQTWHDS